jgi:hypothetical protein
MHYLRNLIVILFSILYLASNASAGISADDKAYRNLANQIVAEFNQRNTVTFNESFDVDAFMKEVFKDLNDDRIKIIDWYDFGTGMKYSESVRQILVLALNDLSLLSRVFNIMKGQKNG